MLGLNRYVIGAVVMLGVIASAWFAGERHGRLSCEAKQAKAADTIAKDYREAADGLADSESKRDQEVKVIIKEVYREVDSSGCSDARSSDSVLDALRPSAD